MQAEHAIAVAGLGFLLVNGLLLVVSVRRGRELCRSFAERLPTEYAELGSPLPGFFDSPRRDAYFRMLMQRGFRGLTDPHLVAEFAERRRIEVRQLVFLLLGFGGLGVAFLWLRYVHAA